VTDDPGVARERTQLAWGRTAASFAAVGLAVLRTSPAVGAVVMAMSATVWSMGRLSGRQPAGATLGRGLTQRRKVQLIAAATTLVSLTGLTLTISSFPWP